MANVNTAQVIKDAREELKTRVEDRARNDKRIAELRIMLRTLVRFTTDDATRDQIMLEVRLAKRETPSLQAAVHDCLMRNPDGLTSNQIRDDLEQEAFDLEEYSQPLSAIMTCLSRLVKSDSVKRRVTTKGVVFRIKEFDEELRKK
jgi:hypothetical protein